MKKKTFRTYEPNQVMLFPPSLDEWVPENHLARFINDVVEEIDIEEIQKVYENELRGYPPHHPRMMLKLLIYGYCTGMRSSRKIAAKTIDDVAFRFLSANNFPKFRSIADFRQRYLAAFKSIFLDVLLICREAGLIGMGHVALDGTKIQANASKHKSMSYERILTEEERLAEEIQTMVKEAGAG